MTAAIDALWFDTPVYNGTALAEMVVRFGINLAIATYLIVIVYYRRNRHHEWVSTMFMFNVTVFFLVYIMNGLDLDVGFGFGLFALFAVLRFRTVSIPIVEMTFAFAVIGLAVINAISIGALSWAEILFADLGLAICMTVISGLWLDTKPLVQTLRYDRIDLVHADRREDLLADLGERTGLDIVGAEVSDLDFLNDTATVRIHYRR